MLLEHGESISAQVGRLKLLFTPECGGGQVPERTVRHPAAPLVAIHVRTRILVKTCLTSELCPGRECLPLVPRVPLATALKGHSVSFSSWRWHAPVPRRLFCQRGRRCGAAARRAPCVPGRSCREDLLFGGGADPGGSGRRALGDRPRCRPPHSSL